jgi:hypothetical protein
MYLVKPVVSMILLRLAASTLGLGPCPGASGLPDTAESRLAGAPTSVCLRYVLFVLGPAEGFSQVDGGKVDAASSCET